MNVEITGVNFVNKGAELMMRAAAAEVASWEGVHRAAVHFRVGTAARRRAAGLGHVARLESIRLEPIEGVVNGVLDAASSLSRGSGRVIRERDVDVVFDASGFLYSDQWGEAAAGRAARLYGRWRRGGKRIVMLPQAFGPFRDPAVRGAVARALAAADLVFARERVSYEHVSPLASDPAKLRIAPDFTIGLPAGPSELPNSGTRGDVVFVPNVRMIDKADAGVGIAYPALLASAIRDTRRLGFRPVVLLFEPQDRAVVSRLAAEGAGGVPVVEGRDAVELKALLSSPALVVASRFHALVCALSQGVPCLGFGWSHKYRMLFDDYGCGDRLLPATAAPEIVRARMAESLDPATGDEQRRRLLERAARSKSLVEDMWADVRAVVGVRRRPAVPESRPAPREDSVCV